MKEIKVKVIRSKRRTVGLEINDQGRLIVRAPYHLETSTIDDILRSHQQWIKKKLEEAERRQQLFQPKKFISGEKFLFLGKEYPLLIVNRIRPALLFDGERFELSSAFRQLGRQVFERWYRKQALIYLSQKTSKIARKTGFSFKKLRISSARTRWGSCSGKGTVSFAWRLIMAPPEIIDYVIIHELAHTKEKNHSRAFWNLVAHYIPDYKEKRCWLRANGFLFNL